jgi:hypothetical protein
MRYLISIFFILVLSSHNCSAQNEKLNISSVINSIYFSKEGLNIRDQNQKMIFCLATKKNTKIKSLDEFVNFNSFNSKKMQILYADEENKILRKLKNYDSIEVVRISLSQNEDGNLVLLLDIGSTNYKLFKTSKFKFTILGDLFKAYYKSFNNKWVIDHIDRI